MPGQPAGRTTGSPADLAGLCAGDTITAVDGTSLDASYPFDLVISHLAPGTSVSLRDVQTTQITVVPGDAASTVIARA